MSLDDRARGSGRAAEVFQALRSCHWWWSCVKRMHLVLFCSVNSELMRWPFTREVPRREAWALCTCRDTVSRALALLLGSLRFASGVQYEDFGDLPVNKCTEMYLEPAVGHRPQGKRGSKIHNTEISVYNSIGGCIILSCFTEEQNTSQPLWG